MSEQQNRDALERYVEAFERQDLFAIADLMHEDYLEEFPQSGERIRGKQNARTILENYPGLPSLIEHSYVLSGDLGVIKLTLDYDSQRIYACEAFGEHGSPCITLAQSHRSGPLLWGSGRAAAGV